VQPKPRPKGDRIFLKKSTCALKCNQNRDQKGIEFKKKKRSTYGLGCNQNRGQKGAEFIKKKKEAHMASGVTKTEAKRPDSMASGSTESRQKRALWLRVFTEAKSYALLALPQYASVREPVHNIKNNRCQNPFLHWC